MTIAYDCMLKKPGCALLQAAKGCSSTVAHKFHPDTWLLYPTADLKVYEVTEAQMAKLILITEQAYKRHAQNLLPA